MVPLPSVFARVIGLLPPLLMIFCVYFRTSHSQQNLYQRATELRETTILTFLEKLLLIFLCLLAFMCAFVPYYTSDNFVSSNSDDTLEYGIGSLLSELSERCIFGFQTHPYKIIPSADMPNVPFTDILETYNVGEFLGYGCVLYLIIYLTRPLFTIK